MSNKDPVTPDRNLGPLDVWAMAFGLMVGWGVFVMPGTTFLPVAGPLGTIIAMLVGTIVVLVVAHNFTYLMGRTPSAGGVYAFAKEAFGRDHAFISSWFLCLSYLTIVFLNGTALFVVVRTFFGESLQVGFSYSVAENPVYLGEALVSISGLALVGALIVLFQNAMQKLHTVLAVLLAVGVLVTFFACLPRAIASGSLSAFGSSGLNPAYGIFSLVILAPWAFVGFEATSFETPCFRFPTKRIRALLPLAVVLAGFAYASMAVVAVAFVPDGYSNWPEYIAALDGLKGVLAVPTFNTAREIMGPVGLVAMGVTALSSILTGLIGGYRATTRVLSTMAEDRILSEGFTRATNAILFIMFISMVLALLGRNTLNWFVDLTAFGAIVGFGYTSAAAWKIAKTENNRRIVVTASIGTIVSASFGVVQLVPRLTAMEAMGSEAFLLLSLWCLLGFVFYWSTVRRSTLTDFSGMSVSGVVLFALLLYSAFMWMAKLLMATNIPADTRETVVQAGTVLLVIVFTGLAVMLYVQNLVRKKHEATERDKIRAVEGSLAKSQFLFNMSHDIRTPMNAIVGYTGLALKEPSSPQIHDYLEKIDISSQHLLGLINDILEMSRIESGKVQLDFAPEDLREILGDIKILFSEQMKERNMDFSVHLSQVRNPYVWCDRKNLNRVLLNVVSNAFKFTPLGGTVSVSLWESGHGENGYGSYEIRVRDSGIGMSKRFVEKMFTAFERERTSTNSGVEGTGLGLAITKRIVDMMDGTIEVMTSPGNGTEMIIRLKLRLASASDIPEKTPKEDSLKPGGAANFKGKRVLLVEDNLVNMEIAKLILTQVGFEVETAENGKAGVDKVANSEPGHYDLVLMDIQMPVMDGYTATKCIRALENPALANIPVVAMTANAFAEDVKAAEDAGMQAHIAKPVDVQQMIATLSKLLCN